MIARIVVKNDETCVYVVTLAFPKASVENFTSSLTRRVHLLQKQIQNKN
jgi:hypothetical protein